MCVCTFISSLLNQTWKAIPVVMAVIIRWLSWDQVFCIIDCTGCVVASVLYSMKIFQVDVVIDGSCSLNESSTTLQKQFGVD